MVKEAEAHAEEDKRRKELVEARNQADLIIYTIEKTLKENEGRLPANLKGEIEQAISSTREAMQTDDIQRIRQASERLTQASQSLGDAVNRAAAQANQSAASGAQGEPEVVDAEFEEVDKRDRKTG